MIENRYSYKRKLTQDRGLFLLKIFIILLCTYIIGFVMGCFTVLGAQEKKIVQVSSTNIKARGRELDYDITGDNSIYIDEIIDTQKNHIVNPERGGSWPLILVNGNNPLPVNYVPNLTSVESGYQFDMDAADYLKEMLEAAREEGLNPVICSAYRSVEKQTRLYENEKARNLSLGYSEETAAALAATEIALPGTSEHNLGLAVDIVALDYQLLDREQANTPESIWLRENCYKFGFILRYPEDKIDITGIIYEPWHFRYVGLAVAEEIMLSGICLEEYLGVA